MSTRPFGVEASPGELRVTGEVDLAVAAPLLDAILSTGLAGDLAALGVDMSRVTFLDSTGIATLVEARNRLAEHGIVLQVLEPAPSVRRVLALAGVSRFLGLPEGASVDRV